MGAIKEKIHELAEIAEQIIDSGASDEQLDAMMKKTLQYDDEYEFYLAHKDVIHEILGWEPEEDDDDEENNLDAHYNRRGFVDNDPIDYSSDANPNESLDVDFMMPKLNEDSFDEEEFLMKKGREGNREKYYPGAGDEDLSGEKEFKRDVVYHGRSEMPEDLVDDFDTSRNPDEEAPQSYEDWLDDVYWRISTNYDHDIDEDYTRELFQQHEDELRDIFDSGADVDEASQLIEDYDKEENADEYGSYCENCGDEFVDGICPECGANQEGEYLDEGCNCGGKKRPIQIIRRPNIRVTKPVKKLHEELEMPKLLNEVDYEYMARMNRETDRAPRYAGGYTKQHTPTKTVELSGDRYDYTERKEALKRIARKQEILKGLGYDLDNDEESPELAPTKKEFKQTIQRRRPNMMIDPTRFNQLKKDYHDEEIMMDRLHKKHARSHAFEGIVNEGGKNNWYYKPSPVSIALANREKKKFLKDHPDAKITISGRDGFVRVNGIIAYDISSMISNRTPEDIQAELADAYDKSLQQQ